ncbi:hypothetical protein H0H87_008074 [Tephrocybe sp. NHM501043]|nr:hypothetical protein H0H87_008074 [Tephrocybe sp. NHM501043]
MPAICLFVLFACLHSVVAQNLLHKCGGLAPAQYIIGLKREVNMAAFIQKAGITPTEQFDFINSFSALRTLMLPLAIYLMEWSLSKGSLLPAVDGDFKVLFCRNDATWGLHRLKVQKRIPSTLGGKVLE